MALPFKKISENFFIDWDIKTVIGKFIHEKVFSDDPTIRQLPISDPSGALHWQVFSPGLAFSRNFYINFPNECEQIANKIRALQCDLLNTEITTDDYLIKSFLEHTVNKHGINLIRILPGKGIGPHFDITRDISINIGLQNSETCTTNIAFTPTVDNFYKNPMVSYTMNDGDVYLLLVKNAHSVTSNISTDSDRVRYIITYNINVA